MTREALLQAVRDWAVAVSALADSHVIVESDEGPRPSMPYLVVGCQLFGVPVGTDVVKYDLGGAGGTQRQWMHGHRRATLRVAGYGTGVPDLLQAITLRIWDPTLAAAADALGISVARVLSPPQTMRLARGSRFELAGLLDLEVVYVAETVKADTPGADIIEIDTITLETASGPTDLEVTASIGV